MDAWLFDLPQGRCLLTLHFGTYGLPGQVGAIRIEVLGYPGDELKVLASFQLNEHRDSYQVAYSRPSFHIGATPLFPSACGPHGHRPWIRSPHPVRFSERGTSSARHSPVRRATKGRGRVFRAPPERLSI
jgi:hypothetical protein